MDKYKDNSAQVPELVQTNVLDRLFPYFGIYYNHIFTIQKRIHTFIYLKSFISYLFILVAYIEGMNL